MKSMLVALAVTAFLSMPAAAITRPAQQKAAPAATIYDVPPEHWHARLISPPHSGAPVILVTIDDGYAWPRRDGRPNSISYRITATAPGGKVFKNVGFLTERERFSVVALGVPYASLLRFGKSRRRSNDEFLVADPVVGRKLNLNNRYLRYRINLTAYVDDDAFHQDGKTKTPTAPKFTWGKKIEDGPLAGKTPEERTKELLEKRKDAICGAKNAQQKLRFEKECEKLKKMLAKDPPEPKIECTLPTAKGTTNKNTGLITLDGDELLGDPYPDMTLVHELSHAVDIDEGKAAKTKEGLQKKANGEPLGNELRQAIVKELFETELRALFRILDNSDYFDYPAKAEGTAAIKANIKLMIKELIELGVKAVKPADAVAKASLVDCLKKIRDWINAHDDIKKNIAKDPTDVPDLTWGQYLDKSIEIFGS